MLFVLTSIWHKR